MRTARNSNIENLLDYNEAVGGDDNNILSQEILNEGQLYLQGTSACTKELLCPITNFVAYERLSPQYKVFVTSLISIVILKLWKKACRDKNWKEAMDTEMKILEKKQHM